MKTVWILYFKSRGPQRVESIFTSEETALKWMHRKIQMDNDETEKRNAKRFAENPKLPSNRFAPLWTISSSTSLKQYRWERGYNRGQDLEYYLLVPQPVTESLPTQTYRIPVEWTMTGFMTLKATSLEEAVEIVYDAATEFPEGDYVDGSFKIIHEELEDWNN